MTGGDNGNPKGGSTGDRRERRRAEEVSGAQLPPGEIDRMFDLLAEAIEADRLSDDQFDRLTAILRESVERSGSDPEQFTALLSLLERALLAPDGPEPGTDGLLAPFEAALAAVTDGDGELAAVLDVVREGIRDPAAVDPADVDRFRAGTHQLLFGTESGQGWDPLSGGAEHAEGIDPFQLAGLAAVVIRRASGNAIEAGLRAGTRLAYAAANTQSPAALVTTARAITLDELQRAGIDIGERRAGWLQAHEEATAGPRPATREALERRGARLIDRSAAVGRDESIHPAFAEILGQLSTDEARILRLLATEGPQGVVDIYDRQYLPPKRWRVARNLTMLGRDAGCRIQRRTPVYVRNLRRLGVAEISEEPVGELERYEIIEAQSHVEHARTRAKRPRSEYKRFQLTDLGVELCELCFPFEVTVDGEGLARREESGAER